ncbi:MAG TPA: hypothetical protein VNZ43_04460 [Sphingomonadaceae bacterium]|nr:hypothetical protein [Sphingomonadaceae bacterium]
MPCSPPFARRLLLIPLFCASLAGCAQDEGAFPSLAPRPIEKIAIGDVTPESPAAEPRSGVIDSELDATAARELAAAEASVAPFEAQLAETRTKVAAAKGIAPGEELWVIAQQSISRLEELRGPAQTALASLDRLRIEAAQRHPAIDTSRIEAAWTRTAEIQKAQATAYAELTGALRPA